MNDPVIDPKRLEEQINAIVPPVAEDPEYYRAIAYLWASGGATHEQISMMLGRDIKEIQDVLNMDRIKLLVSDIRKKSAGKDHDLYFRRLLPDAIQVTESVMNDRTVKPGTRLAAASTIMDRALGKPNQNVEIGSSSIRQFLERLDQIERQKLESGAIEVEGKRVHNVEEGELVEDPQAKWVKENL